MLVAGRHNIPALPYCLCLELYRENMEYHGNRSSGDCTLRFANAIFPHRDGALPHVCTACTYSSKLYQIHAHIDTF